GDGTTDLALADLTGATIVLTRTTCGPLLISVSPNSGPTAGGQNVTITGKRLAGATAVTFGGVAATITSNSSCSIHVTTPAGSGVVDVAVSTPGGSIMAAGAYTYVSSAPPTPGSVIATAFKSQQINILWSPVAGASWYEVQRRAAYAGFVTIGSTPDPYFADTSFPQSSSAFLYRVKSVNVLGSSPVSPADLAVSTIFDDQPLTAGTPVKAAHINQLRFAITEVRYLAGLASGTYTDSIGAGVRIKAIHVTELRTALDAALAVLGIPSPAYTDATLSGVRMKVAHIQELRNRIR
ncbi:MAG: IPT/TIG domain-containing protein, partial [Acidobacteriota bacterium]